MFLPFKQDSTARNKEKPPSGGFFHGRLPAKPCYVALHNVNVLFSNARLPVLAHNANRSMEGAMMELVIATVLLLFFVFPLFGGVLAFVCGAIRPRFHNGKVLSGWHPLNPYYKLSPYHFGKR